MRKQLASAIAAGPLSQRINPKSVVREVQFTPPTNKGTTYRIIVTNETDPYSTPVPLEALLGAGPHAPALGGDNFAGTARRTAKLSIATGAVEVFADLKDLIDTLPTLTAMTHHHPPIVDNSSSKRVTEEQRNVQLRVWLYAAKSESDNDFHLIFGRAPGLTPFLYMTMELSGLPSHSAASYSKLKASRDVFKKFFGTHLPGTTYSQYDPPIPVEINGSLFFDITHATGPGPGPSKLRPHMPTIWEVHPITGIVFEP